MAFSDTFTGSVNVAVSSRITSSEGSVEGVRNTTHSIVKTLTQGTGTNQGDGVFSSTFTAATGGTTVSLADSADPLGAVGDDTPTSDPEGLKLRCVLIENLDGTNFVSFKKGTNGDTAILSGATDSIKITAGGMLLWYSPAGVNAMNDGTDDEYVLTADTAGVSVKLTYIYG